MYTVTFTRSDMKFEIKFNNINMMLDTISKAKNIGFDCKVNRFIKI
jgi:hypothetical protein